MGGSDELAVLGQAFDTMTTNLRSTIETEKAGRARIDKLLETEKQRRERTEKLLATIREAVNRLSASTAEILASTTQQASRPAPRISRFMDLPSSCQWPITLTPGGAPPAWRILREAGARGPQGSRPNPPNLILETFPL